MIVSGSKGGQSVASTNAIPFCVFAAKFSYLRDLRVLRGECLFPHFAPWQEILPIATILH